MAQQSFYATGKRKTAIARVWLKPGEGNITVNKQALEKYFGGLVGESQKKIESPLSVTNSLGKYDVVATLKGGGISAQTEALRHGIARALLEVDSENRVPLKRAGFLTRDPREKERKKYGQKGARARFQFSKR